MENGEWNVDDNLGERTFAQEDSDSRRGKGKGDAPQLAWRGKLKTVCLPLSPRSVRADPSRGVPSGEPRGDPLGEAEVPNMRTGGQLEKKPGGAAAADARLVSVVAE